MTTINLSEINNNDLNNLRNLHGQYPFHIVCYLGDLELGPDPEPGSYQYAPYTYEDGCETEGYLIENRQQLYDFIKDLSHKIYEDLDYRSQKNLGAPHDDETSDIYNAIDVLKALSELDFQ